nr:MAG TPA: hypothetical protein [Caudoviricetes sp.]
MQCRTHDQRSFNQSLYTDCETLSKYASLDLV